jgi:hypothetical protein
MTQNRGILSSRPAIHQDALQPPAIQGFLLRFEKPSIAGRLDRRDRPQSPGGWRDRIAFNRGRLEEAGLL